MHNKKFMFREIISFINVFVLFIVVCYNFWFQIDFLLRSENVIRNVTVFGFIWFLSLYALALVVITPNIVVRWFWTTIFAISMFCHLFFQSISGESLSLGDVRKFWIERSEADAALFFYWSEALLPLVIAITFIVSMISLQSLFELKRRKSILIQSIAIPAMTITIITIMMISKGAGAGLGFSGFYTFPSLLSVTIYDDINSQTVARHDIYQSNITSPQIDNIVVIIDESVSGDFISFDESRSITPHILKYSDKIVNYGVATSGHNCSSYSNAIIRWGVTPNALDNALTQPTIWQYAKNAKFTTAYIDAQKQPGTFSNFMNMSEMEHIDKVKQFNVPQVERDNDFIQSDFNTIPYLDELLTANSNSFVYINKLGVHFPYEGKYPEEQAQFQPKMSLFEPIGYIDKTKLTNSYKNAIAWNVNGFFQRLIDQVDLSNTVIIYTSDHGQNLLDKGVGTHCGRGDVSGYQALVPFFVLTENKKLLDSLQKHIGANYNNLSHYNIFPTLLMLLGYKHDFIRTHYGQSIDLPVERIGKFAKGNLFAPHKSDRAYDWHAVSKSLPSRLYP